MKKRLSFKYSTWESPKNQCPYCADKINKNQVRCDSCGERLIKTDHMNDYNEIPSKLNGLRNVTNGKLILYSLILTLCIIILNYQFMKYYNLIINESYFIVNLTTYYLLYISFAILIGYEIYIFKKAKLILAISFCFYIFPIILMALYSPYIILEKVRDNILAIVIIFALPLLVIKIFRKREITMNVGEIITDNKEYSIAICNFCNETTKIGEKRLFDFIGKKKRYFCDNCGKYLIGDPFANILVGLCGIVIFIVMTVGYVLSYVEIRKKNIVDSLFLILFIIILWEFETVAKYIVDFA